MKYLLLKSPFLLPPCHGLILCILILKCVYNLPYLLLISLIPSFLWFSINICRLLLPPFDDHIPPPYHFLFSSFSITWYLIGTLGPLLPGSTNMSPVSFSLFHCRPSYVCPSLSHWCPLGYSLFISALIIFVLFSYQYICWFLVSGYLLLCLHWLYLKPPYPLVFHVCTLYLISDTILP